MSERKEKKETEVVYHPDEAREEDLAVLVFVFQLFGDSDKIGAG